MDDINIAMLQRDAEGDTRIGRDRDVELCVVARGPHTTVKGHSRVRGRRDCSHSCGDAEQESECSAHLAISECFTGKHEKGETAEKPSSLLKRKQVAGKGRQFVDSASEYSRNAVRAGLCGLLPASMVGQTYRLQTELIFACAGQVGTWRLIQRIVHHHERYWARSSFFFALIRLNRTQKKTDCYGSEGEIGYSLEI